MATIISYTNDSYHFRGESSKEGIIVERDLYACELSFAVNKSLRDIDVYGLDWAVLTSATTGEVVVEFNLPDILVALPTDDEDAESPEDDFLYDEDCPEDGLEDGLEDIAEFFANIARQIWGV